MLIRRRNLCLTLNYSRISLQMKTKGKNFKKFLPPDYSSSQESLCCFYNKKKIMHNNNILLTRCARSYNIVLTTQK